MPRKKGQSVPKLCRHKTLDRAYVTDPGTGKQVYFGPWGLAETQRKYAAWLARLAARREAGEATPQPEEAGAKLVVYRLVEAYMDWAERYYVKNDKPTSEVGAIRCALAPVVELFGTEPAAEFGAGHLKRVRQAYLDKPITSTRGRRVRQPGGAVEVVSETVTHRVGYCLDTANKMVGRVRRLFRWAVEQELVPVSVLATLEAVRDLPAGRGMARETGPVEPVPAADLEATLAALGERTAVLVRLQILLACRPDELLMLRPCDLDRSATPWVYRPESHKTQHKGRTRTIHVGPQARALLLPLLEEGGADDRYLFDSRGRGHRRRYRGRLTVSGYRRAVARACRRAGVPHWFPAQLRHNGLTLVRQAAGLEAAQAVGDHAEISTTQIYAERLTGLAREVIERIG